MDIHRREFEWARNWQTERSTIKDDSKNGSIENSKILDSAVQKELF